MIYQTYVAVVKELQSWRRPSANDIILNSIETTDNGVTIEYIIPDDMTDAEIDEFAQQILIVANKYAAKAGLPKHQIDQIIVQQKESNGQVRSQATDR